MNLTTTICDELEDYMKREAMTLHLFAEKSGVNAGTLSGILNGNRPIAIGQLDRLTHAMGLPEGSLYELFVDECFISAAPHWRRLRPFLLRCAELKKLDCIREVLFRLLEDLKQITGIFETAELMFERGWYDAAIIMYESVIESERSNHSERLAISYYRIFHIHHKEGQKSLKAAAQFLPFRHRLPESLILDGLVMLLEMYYINKDWEEVEKYSDELCELVNVLYKNNRWKDAGFSPARPFIYYYGMGCLYRGASYEYRKMYDESRKWIGKYADLSWFEDLDESNLVEVERYKMFAKANLLSIDIKDGNQSRIPEYIKFLQENPSEILEGLTSLLESANRHKFFVDEHLSKFSDEIQFYSEVTREAYSKQNETSVRYKEHVHTFRCSLFFQKYAIYCFRKKLLADGLKNTLQSFKYSLKIDNRHIMVNSMTLFELYRDYTTPKQRTAFKKMCREVWENNEELNVDDYNYSRN
ncbi:XRE family transcriptional regulator [Paenibacillus lentus]|uniref:XRE family transcriptional regulator n=1 Tax=Paenibacillus lentus TaxID=1338368 RepID=UPI00364D1B30